MKRLFRIALFANLVLVASLSSNAQSIIIKGGFTSSSMTIESKDQEKVDDFSSRAGFHIGAAFEVPIAGGLCFEPGVLYTTKGYTIDDEYTAGGITTKAEGALKFNYIDVPLNLKYKFDLNNLSVWGSIGPYMGIGLSGKHKFEVTVNDKKIIDIDKDVEFGSDKNTDKYKKLDYGLGIGAGIEYNNILFGINYNIGMANISNDEIFDTKLKHGVLNISVGYRLGK